MYIVLRRDLEPKSKGQTMVDVADLASKLGMFGTERKVILRVNSADELLGVMSRLEAKKSYVKYTLRSTKDTRHEKNHGVTIIGLAFKAPRYIGNKIVGKLKTY